MQSPTQTVAEVRNAHRDSGLYSSGGNKTVLSSQECPTKEIKKTPIEETQRDSQRSGDTVGDNVKCDIRGTELQHTGSHQDLTTHKEGEDSSSELYDKPSGNVDASEKRHRRSLSKDSRHERRSSINGREDQGGRDSHPRYESRRRSSRSRSVERQRSSSYGSHEESRSERRRRESQRSSHSHRSPDKYSPDRDRYRKSRHYSGGSDGYDRGRWSPEDKIVLHFVPGMRCPVESCFPHIYEIKLQFDIHWKNVHYPEKERYTCRLCPGGPYDEDPAHFEDLEYHFSKHHRAIKLKLLDKGELETVLREISVTNQMYSSPGRFSYESPTDLQRILYMEPETLPTDWPDDCYGPPCPDQRPGPMPSPGPRGPPFPPRGPPGGPPHGRFMGPYRPRMMGPNQPPMRPNRPPFGPPMRPNRPPLLPDGPRMGPRDSPRMPRGPPGPPGPRMRLDRPPMCGPRSGPPRPDGPRMRHPGPPGPPGPRPGPHGPPPRNMGPPFPGPRPPRPQGPGPGPQMSPLPTGPRPSMGPWGLGPRPPMRPQGPGPRPPSSPETPWPASRPSVPYTSPPPFPSRPPFPGHPPPQSSQSPYVASQPVSARSQLPYGATSHLSGLTQPAVAHISQVPTNYNQPTAQSQYNIQPAAFCSSAPSFNQPPPSMTYTQPAMGYTQSSGGYYQQTVVPSQSTGPLTSQPPPLTLQPPAVSYQQHSMHPVAYSNQPARAATYTQAAGAYIGQPGCGVTYTQSSGAYTGQPALGATYTQTSGAHVGQPATSMSYPSPRPTAWSQSPQQASYSVRPTATLSTSTTSAYYPSSQPTTTPSASTRRALPSTQQEEEELFDSCVMSMMQNRKRSASTGPSRVDTVSQKPAEVPQQQSQAAAKEDNQQEPKKPRVKSRRLHFKPNMQCPVQGCDNVQTYHLKAEFDNHWREKHMSKGGSAYGHCKLCIQKGSIFTISLERQEALYQHFTKSHPHVNLKVNEPSSFIAVKQKLDSTCIDPRPWQYNPGALVISIGKKKSSAAGAPPISSSAQSTDPPASPVLVCPENSCRNTGSFSSMYLFENHWQCMHLNEEFGPCSICLRKGMINILTLMEMEDVEAHFAKFHQDINTSGANQNSYIILGSETSGANAGTERSDERRQVASSNTMSQSGTEVRIAWSKVVPEYIYLHYKRVCSNNMTMETITGEDTKYFVIPPTAQFEYMDVQYFGSCRLCNAANNEQSIAMHKDNVSAHFKEHHSYIEIL